MACLIRSPPPLFFNADNPSDSLTHIIAIEVVTGVSLSESNSEQTSIFPNPISDALNIDFGELPLGISQLEMVHIVGKRVYFQNIKKSSQKISMDLSALKSGVYWALLKQNQSVRLKDQLYKK